MGNDRTVLIVEDSALLRAVVRDALEKEQFVVSEAENGKIGLEMALRDHPDIIMLDLMMPVMGGIEALSLLRKDAWGGTVPVIILTGTKDEKINEELKKDTHLDFLLKENWMMDEVVIHVKKGLGIDEAKDLSTIVEHVKKGLGKD
jgi:CheY-like chemotaxis protein